MEYKQCNFCVMDTTDEDIIFDNNGQCNHCKNAKILLEQIEARKKDFVLDQYILSIKNKEKKHKYDCIVGISGGVDSCYTVYLAKKIGLRPLAVHFDNGWNSELSVQNIRLLLEKLDVDLYTYVVDWQEFRDLQLAFLKASTPDIEIPTDHMIEPVLSMVAHYYKVKHIFLGCNINSESILPNKWSHGHGDWRYIKNIHKKFGTISLSTFPYFTRLDRIYFHKKVSWFSLLDYIDYDKMEAKSFLSKNFGWRDYGGKHYESFYTRFYQNYILPQKFGFDKRKMHLSSLIVAGQITREDALNELNIPLCDETEVEKDKDYFIEKMQITREDFDRIMHQEKKSYWDYPNYENDFWGKLRCKLERIGKFI